MNGVPYTFSKIFCKEAPSDICERRSIYLL